MKLSVLSFSAIKKSINSKCFPSLLSIGALFDAINQGSIDANVFCLFLIAGISNNISWDGWYCLLIINGIKCNTGVTKD